MSQPPASERGAILVLKMRLISVAGVEGGIEEEEGVDMGRRRGDDGQGRGGVGMLSFDGSCRPDLSTAIISNPARNLLGSLHEPPSKAYRHRLKVSHPSECFTCYPGDRPRADGTRPPILLLLPFHQTRTMLLATPTEIQTEICSYLNPPSLAMMARVSHQVHLVAIPLLYRTVTIHRWNDLLAFFALDKALIPKDPELARERAQRRRADLECIRRLVLDFPFDWEPDTVGPVRELHLSRSLRLRSAPLQLELLRITFPCDLRPVLAVLQSVSPRTIELQRYHELSKPQIDFEFNIYLMVSNRIWDRLETLTYGAVNLEGYAALGGRSVRSTPFRTVREAVFRMPSRPSAGPRVYQPSLLKLVDFCPNLAKLRIETRKGTEVKELEGAVHQLVRNGVEVEVVVAPKVMFEESGRSYWPGDETDDSDEEV